MEKDVLSLRYVLGLHSDKLRNSDSFVALLGQAEQGAPVFEVDLPGVQNGPGDR